MAASRESRSARRVWFLTSAGTAAWLTAIVLAPWLMGHGRPAAARFIYAVFSPLCHQILDRCFAVEGLPMAVCGRCFGIYAGFAAGLVAFPLIRGFAKLSLPSARVFAVMTLPLVLDAGGGILGLWRSPIGLRFATGLVWGALLPFYFIPGVADLFRARAERRKGRPLEMAAPKN